MEKHRVFAVQKILLMRISRVLFVVLEIREVIFRIVLGGEIFINKSRCYFIELIATLGIIVEVVTFVQIFAGLVFSHIIIEKSFVEVAAFRPHYTFTFIEIHYQIQIALLLRFVLASLFLFFSTHCFILIFAEFFIFIFFLLFIFFLFIWFTRLVFHI